MLALFLPALSACTDPGAIPLGASSADSAATTGEALPGTGDSAAASDIPVATPGRGVYAEAVAVELAAPAGATRLHYTLDGSAPSSETSTIYAGPIEIAPSVGQGVVILRAAADDGAIATWSYIFPNNVVDQPSAPSDVPETWGVGDTIAADYEMDPSVIGPDRRAAVAALGELPFVSIVMEPDDLWGRDGLYMNPSEAQLERAASFELWSPDGATTQADCGLRVQGGSSTGNWKSAKLSLRARFSGEYGPPDLEFPVFPGAAVERFDNLVLDAHLNNTWTHPSHDERIIAQYVPDPFVSDLMKSVGPLAPNSRFVQLYLNGLYWGVYDLHERPDAAFAAAWLGGAPDEWDALRHDGTLVDGDTEAWETMFAVARGGVRQPDRYAELTTWLEVGAFVDYMIVNFYAGNTDWPHHNWYAIRQRTGTAGFQFVSWDAELVLMEMNEDMTRVNAPNGPGELYQALLANDEFRSLLAAHAAALLAAGAPLGAEAAAAAYEARIAEVRSSILLESARWGDNQRPGQPYTVADWEAELKRLRTDYFPVRSEVVAGQLSRL